MTQTQDPPIFPTPARRRALPAAPVLIRIPAVASGPHAPGRRARRRRLRREVRVVGYFLLATLPISLAFASFGGGDRRPALNAPGPTTEVGPTAPMIPALTISMEPAPARQAPDFAAPPVFLSGQLLPADAPPQETSHGGH